MALILEVVAPGRGGQRERRVVTGTLTIGRALDNDIVLDDPHVDAHHARLEVTAEGGWVLVDLESVNRIGVAGEGRADRVELGLGLTVTLGRTALRLLDPAMPVPPAILLKAAAATGTMPAAEPAFLAGVGKRIGVIAAMLAIVGLGGWLDSTQRGAASEVFSQSLIVLFLLFLWAGIWSIASRAVLGRFNFLLHAAIGALAMIGITLSGRLMLLLKFFIPGTDLEPVVEGLTYLVAIGALTSAHLGAASHLRQVSRRLAGAIAAGVLFLLGMTSMALEDDRFSPFAEFNSTVLTFDPRLVPQQSTAEFAQVRKDLKAEVDSLLAKAADSTSSK